MVTIAQSNINVQFSKKKKDVLELELQDVKLELRDVKSKLCDANSELQDVK